MYDVLVYSWGVCAFCMFPHLLCNVDVMISTLQKAFQYAGLSLVGPSSSSRIGSHIGHDSTPPPSTVHPALHSMWSCSTTPPRAPLHRLLFIQPSTTPRGPIHPEAMPPLTVHPINWLQLAAIAKESLDQVQLTAIDRSLGFSNA